MSSFITVNYHYVRPIKNSKFSNLKGLEVKEFINQINYLKSKYNIISATDIINTIDDETGAAPGLPVTDAIWKISNGEIEKTLDRDFIFRAQTPQGFPFSKILEAHEHKSDERAFDDVELAKKFGLKVILKTGHKDNMKITTPDDFLKMSKILVKKFGR